MVRIEKKYIFIIVLLVVFITTLACTTVFQENPAEVTNESELATEESAVVGDIAPAAEAADSDNIATLH